LFGAPFLLRLVLGNISKIDCRFGEHISQNEAIAYKIHEDKKEISLN